MASQDVRLAFRASLQAEFPSVAFVESIAVRVDNNSLPPLWMSLEFIQGVDQAMCIGKPTLWRETAVVRVWVVAQSGSGDGAAVAQGDAVAAFYRNWSSSSPSIRTQNVSSPNSQIESDGKWAMFYVDVPYQYDYYV
jgi:hypothetical protein